MWIKKEVKLHDTTCLSGDTLLTWLRCRRSGYPFYTIRKYGIEKDLFLLSHMLNLLKPYDIEKQ